MPRSARLQFEGAFYHVYHRGNRCQPIFLDDFDYARFEAYLFEAMNRSNVRLFNWKQMPNHLHLLLQTPEGNLAEFMQRLLTRYAMYFNRRHSQVGHLFQGRYGAKICDKEAYFRELIRYIQLNAYRSSKLSVDVGRWKWSSHRYLMMPESQWPEGLRVAFNEVLGRFGDTPVEARRRYSEFLADGLEDSSWEDFYKPKGDQFLGDDAFVQEIKRRSGQATRQSPRKLRPLSSAEELANEVSALSGLPRQTLGAPGQPRHISRWRQALAYVGRRFYRFSVRDLGREIGRDENAVSQMLRRMASIDERPETRHLLKALAN
jgi:putative transposase